MKDVTNVMKNVINLTSREKHYKRHEKCDYYHENHDESHKIKNGHKKFFQKSLFI